MSRATFYRDAASVWQVRGDARVTISPTEWVTLETTRGSTTTDLRAFRRRKSNPRADRRLERRMWPW